MKKFLEKQNYAGYEIRFYYDAGLAEESRYIYEFKNSYGVNLIGSAKTHSDAVLMAFQDIDWDIYNSLEDQGNRLRGG